MRFWDTSALVPLFVTEAGSDAVLRLYRADPVVVVAWTAAIECVSACVRRHRGRQISDGEAAAVLARVRALRDQWNVAEPTVELRATAERMVASHGLCAGDAIQLASAIVTGAGHETELEMVCLDRRLGGAAAAEGLRVVPRAPI
jgi:predicted nucleic acid-binding protein